MKPLLLTILLATLTKAVFAQSNADTSLKFNQRYTQCERRWVVLPKKAGEQTYSYGFVYIDSRAGFTYDLRGTFKITGDGHYIADTSAVVNTSIKLRLEQNTAKVALVPPVRFSELYVKPQPAWIRSYYTYKDTLGHNLRWGVIYNDAGQCDTALAYLNKVYRVNQHYFSVEFELMFAYNALGRFDEAIKIIKPAMENDPDNPLFYRELGFAYMKQQKYAESIAAYKQGIGNCTNDDMDAKSEMAINLAEVCKAVGDGEEYQLWGAKAKTWAKPGTALYRFIVSKGF